MTTWKASWQNSYQKRQDNERCCNILLRDSRTNKSYWKQTKPQQRDEQRLLCLSRSPYQTNYHVVNFSTLRCTITNTSKNDNDDSVAGKANKSKVIVNYIVICFASNLFSRHS